MWFWDRDKRRACSFTRKAMLGRSQEDEKKKLTKKTTFFFQESYPSSSSSYILFPLLCGYTASTDSPVSLISSFTLSKHVDDSVIKLHELCSINESANCAVNTRSATLAAQGLIRSSLCEIATREGWGCNSSSCNKQTPINEWWHYYNYNKWTL